MFSSHCTHSNTCSWHFYNTPRAPTCYCIDAILHAILIFVCDTFAILCTSPTKFCIIFVFYFAWVLQSSQEQSKTVLWLICNFLELRGRGQTRFIMGDVQIEMLHVGLQSCIQFGNDNQNFQFSPSEEFFLVLSLIKWLFRCCNSA